LSYFCNINEIKGKNIQGKGINKIETMIVAFATEFILDRDIMTTDKPKRGK
jgi:hypothetical protein